MERNGFLFIGGLYGLVVENDKLRTAGVAVLRLAKALEKLRSRCLTVLFIIWFFNSNDKLYQMHN